MVAATGVGAGDLIAAAVAGSRFGATVLWVVVLGAAIKAVLNEGVSRWQLATGTTLLAGWSRHLPAVVRWYFLGFLVLWGFMVAAALTNACGVAAHALWPRGSAAFWGVVHALAGLALVWWGRYRRFERIMQVSVAVMFLVVVLCGLWLRPDLGTSLRGLFVPAVPAGGGVTLLGLMGGVGGSVTLLCYGYWIREHNWNGTVAVRRTRLDLASAYATTGLFAAALIVIAAAARPGDLSGTALILALANQMGELIGPWSTTAFLIGFWCAVFTSLLGVWQGVPYLFADCLAHLCRREHRSDGNEQLASSRAYRGFLLFLALPPLFLLLVERPVAVVMAYAVTGSFFMPFLAAVLLYLNNQKRWLGPLRNGWMTNAVLVLSLLLFGWLFILEVTERLSGS